MDNLFCALGGGSHIGASCYYLQVDGDSFLLDCGVRSTGSSRLPQLSATSEFLDGIWQLDQVILSHAHMDHIGPCLIWMLDGTCRYYAIPYADVDGITAAGF